MMAPGFDPASVAVAGGDPPNQVLGQFEPDFDGTGEAPGPAVEVEIAEDQQWIVWVDAALESAWAARELAVEWLAVTRIVAPR